MRFARAAAAAAIALFIAGAAAQADVLTLTADRDNTLYFSSTGIFSNGRGQHVFSGNTGGALPRRALLHFDVSAIPAGSTIDSVTLRLYVSRTTSGPWPIDVHRVTADWGEGTSNAAGQEGGGAGSTPNDATWVHTFYPGQFWASAGGDFAAAASATATAGSAGSFVTWSGPALAADVAAWLATPGSNFGWILIGEEEDSPTSKRFNSRENTSAATRPMLTISFTPPAATGACCLPGGCAELPETTCLTQGGVYQGDGSSCSPDPCPAPEGACCLANTACIVMTEAQCDAMGGVYQGDGASCATVECPVLLDPFIDPLPIPAAAQPVSGMPGGEATYELAITEFFQQLHSNLPPTTVWGYAGSFPGPTIEAGVNQPVTVRFINDIRDGLGNLRQSHILPVDLCMHGPNFLGDSPRAVVHLHGGHVPSAYDGQPEDTILPGEEQTFIYPNNQRAATLWYHDHALGITRLNVYMGLAGLYVLRDPAEAALGLPSGEFEVPLVIQDRSFNPDGSLKYPADWQEHYLGDFILVNGKVWPYFEVKRAAYRFRVLNGSNSRTYTLSLSNGGVITQIGTDGGLLGSPVELESLTIAPGERADVIVDFSTHAAGTEIILTNSAPAPFPGGGGPDVPDVMKFIVTNQVGPADSPPPVLSTIEPLNEGDASEVRSFELRRFEEACAGSIWLINGMHYDHITERPRLGETEVWRFVNRSGMLHPMHMHLVMFQVLDRQPFEVVDEEIVPTGPAVPPPPSEGGWKDTVQVGPFEIVRVIARFEDYAGRFPYHCHILEHEDHEMMRQFVAVCPGDFNGDGVRDTSDFFEFFAGFFAAPPDADYNGDGATDTADFFEFFSDFFAGPPCL